MNQEREGYVHMSREEKRETLRNIRETIDDWPNIPYFKDAETLEESLLQGNMDLEGFGREIVKQVKEQYDLESLKDQPTVRAYRDFFWRVGVDPTKNRPAAEALIRSVLRGRALPCINTLVDAYNLASMKTEVALAAFDADKIEGDLFMRFADEGEEFVGIGMEEPMRLRGSEMVVSDVEKLVAVYPHRDAENTKITRATRSVLVMVCGVPGVVEGVLQDAARLAREYIIMFCGGELAKP